MAAAKANKRKRAPGGGAKPSGPIAGKSANFSTRISQDTRDRLDAGAAAAGISISQFAELILRKGLDDRRSNGRDRPSRALCFLLAELIELVSINTGDGESPHEPGAWRTDPFAFEAIRIGFDRLLQMHAPKGDMLPPKPRLARVVILADTPERMAESAANAILFLLQRTNSVDDEGSASGGPYATPTRLSSEQFRTYDIAKAVRDLKPEAKL